MGEWETMCLCRRPALSEALTCLVFLPCAVIHFFLFLRVFSILFFILNHLFSSSTFSCVFCLVMVDLLSFRVFLSCVSFGLVHLFSSSTFSCVFCLVMVDLMSFRVFLSCVCHLDWLWLQVVSADPAAGEGKFNFCLALNMLCFMSRKQKVGLYFANIKVEMNHVVQVHFLSSVLRLLCLILPNNP